MLWILAQDANAGGSPIGLPADRDDAGLYFIKDRPQRNRQRQQQAMQSSLHIGDEVVRSAAGCSASSPRSTTTQALSVGIAPDPAIRMLRQGVLQRVTEDGILDEDLRRAGRRGDRRPTVNVPAEPGARRRRAAPLPTRVRRPHLRGDPGRRRASALISAADRVMEAWATPSTASGTRTSPRGSPTTVLTRAGFDEHTANLGVPPATCTTSATC